MTLPPAGSGRAPPARFWKADLHVHSAVSGDALQDIGILSQFAKSAGYNAIFLTDHTATSVHEIGGVVSNDVTFDDSLSQWGSTTAQGDAAAFDTAGSVFAPQGALVSSPVVAGTKSLHMSVTSPTYGEQFIDYRRGPNLRAKSIQLAFSIYPTRIDGGSGAYVSVALGGDPSIPGRPPNGYTTAQGVISPGKTTILIWQIGAPRLASTDPHARVIANALPYTLGKWNRYVVDVRTGALTWNGAAAGQTHGLDAIPAADQPVDYEGLTQLKLAVAAGSGGTADAYFDAYSLSAPKPWETSASLFVYRNSIARRYDSGTFKVFPGHEMGYSDHAMDFAYDIHKPSQFRIFHHGTSGIATAQAKGYPSQLNHPGLPGGVTQQDAISHLGYGADLMEVAERGEEGYVKDVMIRTWDSILAKGRMVVGTWTSDAHRTEKFGPSTYIWAPALTFRALMRSLYEGRVFLADNAFPGTVLFGPAGHSTDGPYPARYPVWVSPDARLVTVHLRIAGGVPPGGQILWVVNGQPVLTDEPTGSSFETTASFPFRAPFAYVRAELRDAGGRRVAMTEPIFFRAAQLPRGMTARTTGVTTAAGKGYTRRSVRGLDTPRWNAAARRVTLPVVDPHGAAELELDTGAYDVASVEVGGSPAPRSAWHYTPSAHVLRLTVVQRGRLTTAVVGLRQSGDTTAPSPPGALSATALDTGRIALRWGAAHDNTGVTGYALYRDGAPLEELGAATLEYTDDGLQPGRVYTYSVDAIDAAGNRSSRTPAVSAKTFSQITTVFQPLADTYISVTAPAVGNGTAKVLRLDGLPLVRAFVRFPGGSVPGTVERVLLRLTATSQGAGIDVYDVADTGWDEKKLTWLTQPAFAAAAAGSTGGFAAGATVDVDVTSAYVRGAPLALALTTTSTAGVELSSREGASPPLLVVESEQPSR